jgi:hypothetical protein
MLKSSRDRDRFAREKQEILKFVATRYIQICTEEKRKGSIFFVIRENKIYGQMG